MFESKSSTIQNMKDPKKVMRFLRNHKKDIGSWAGFALGVIFIYHFFSDGDFSFFLTLSSLIQMFGFVMVSIQVLMSDNTDILSINTLVCYSIALLSKIISTIIHEGYLPYDASGDFIYRISDIVAFGLCVRTIWALRRKYANLNHANSPNPQIILALTVPTLLMAMFIHPSLNNIYLFDVAWTFALYLEAVAMLPQLYLFTKNGAEIESYVSHYVASQGFSRLSAIIFWIFSFHELNEDHSSGFGILRHYVGHFAMGAQIIQLVILGDFIYHYSNSLRKGIPLRLPMSVC
mmetsp:Transcript_11268/g.12870  ORF Transcript_11268/g.12870 Transcript_11268/m.12870 type:complete len:291 (-) Transcript_11268:130-1002(-)